MVNAAIEIRRAWSPINDLCAIERDAGERYRDAGYAPAKWSVSSVEDFEDYARAGLLWVAVMGARAVGFAVVDVYGDVDHLEELDVLRACQGRGIGAALIKEVIEHGRGRGQRAVTLRTFSTTPWSVGLYRKMGFAIWAPERQPDWMAALIEEEAAQGILAAERLSMRLELGGAG